MKDLLEFFSASVWHFVGVIIFLGVLLEGIVQIIRAVKGKDD